MTKFTLQSKGLKSNPITRLIKKINLPNLHFLKDNDFKTSLEKQLNHSKIIHLGGVYRLLFIQNFSKLVTFKPKNTGSSFQSHTTRIAELSSGFFLTEETEHKTDLCRAKVPCTSRGFLIHPALIHRTEASGAAACSLSQFAWLQAAPRP